MFRLKGLKSSKGFLNSNKEDHLTVVETKSPEKITIMFQGKPWQWQGEWQSKNDLVSETQFSTNTTNIYWHFTFDSINDSCTRLFLNLNVDHTDDAASENFRKYWKWSSSLSKIARKIILISIKWREELY